MQNTTSNTYTFGSTSRIFLPAGFVISYDIEKTINTGYSGDVAKNPFIINGYIEKQFFKKKNGTIRLEAIASFSKVIFLINLFDQSIDTDYLPADKLLHSISLQY